jgi:hypothetical protein
MPQIAKCPHCSAPVSISDDTDAATRVNCPSCQGEFIAADTLAAAAVPAGAVADDTPAGQADALGFLQVTTGEVPVEEMTSTDHLAFLQPQSPAPSADAVVPAPESPPSLLADSPSHAMTYRELFGVDPPADDAPGDRPSAMEAFDFEFLRNSSVLPAPGDISDEPDTLISMVLPGAVETPSTEAAAVVIEPPTTPSADVAQGPAASIPAAVDVPSLDTQSVTMLVVEPAPLADLVESSIATTQGSVADTASPGETASAGSEPDTAAAPEAITPQRAFFQFAVAIADPAAVAEPVVAAAEFPATAPEVAMAAVEPTATAPDVAGEASTTVEVSAAEGDEYRIATEAEEAEPDGAYAMDGDEFAGVSSERPGDDAAVTVLPRERLPHRKQKPGSPIRNFVFVVLGGFTGMFVGYSLLCLIFGAEIDALHIYYKEPAGAASRRVHSSAANQDDGRQKSQFELIEERQEAENAKKH